MDDKQTTDFGYQQIPKKQKTNKVKEVFHSVANKYDIMNDLMSCGIHRWWKQRAIQLTHIRKGHRVLDLAGGTGDLAKQIATLVGDKGQIILADINSSMLQQGRDKLINNGIANIQYVQCNAELLPFADNYFDRITIAFGLRNITDKAMALKNMLRILKPGGCLMILEFSKPLTPGLKPIYDFYSFTVLPWLGKIVADDEASYQYLAESIRMHPDQEHLQQLILECGFDKCEVFNLSGGIVAIHRCYKF